MTYEYKDCVLCGSKNHDVIARQDRNHKPLQVVICRDCGLVFVNPAPPERELNQFYASSYRENYKKIHTPRPRHVFRSGLRALTRIRFLKSLRLPSQAAVLDIGAGMGDFLYLSNRHGFQTQGLEPHQGFARFGKETLGVTIQEKPLQEANFPDESFDAITMHHVLEHMWNPVKSLGSIERFLRPGGKLVVEVPNIMATFHAPHRQFHFAHLYYFSAWTLEAAASQAGFKMASMTFIPYTEHILGVFEKREHPPLNPKNPSNYREIAAKLKRHQWWFHYLTVQPYLRPFDNIFRAAHEAVHTFGRKDHKKILEELLK
ncbi:MAG: methyltransferase domain-containing protein [Candidatus Omnitrophica bacterium]|nr:methyltransferase domain-containing protein [Candidatus Omnitrophota bacterium]